MNKTQQTIDGAYLLSEKLGITLLEAIDVFCKIQQNRILEENLNEMNNTLKRGVQNIVNIHKLTAHN